jgi:hypothetical protein
VQLYRRSFARHAELLLAPLPFRTYKTSESVLSVESVLRCRAS